MMKNVNDIICFLTELFFFGDVRYMDDALLKPSKVRCSVKVGSPWVWDEEWQDYSETSPDVTAVGTLVEVKDPKALRAREFRADMVHGPDSTNEDVIMCDLAPTLEAVLSGTDAVLLVAGVSGGAQADLMDGAEGLAAAAVWQLASELHERQASHRANGAVGYTYHMRLQSFQLAGDTILDLLTDSPEAARLMDFPQGVMVEGVRTASATSADEFMKYVEAAQRRRDPEKRHQTSAVFVIDVTQADYYEGWGLHGRFVLLESAIMDCLAEDKGLVQLREGYDRYRGVYHMRSLVKSWRSGEPGDVNGSYLTWLLRDLLTGGSVEAHLLFCVAQGKPAISIALLEFMEDFSKIHTNPVTQDHRVAGWARAVRSERLMLKQALERGGGGVDRDTRSLVLELEKRLANAERQKEEAQRLADARQDRANNFQDRYVSALESQESMNERLMSSEEEQLKAMQSLVEAQIEASEAKDELSEVQYTDNVLLMMLEQELAEMKESSEKTSADLTGKQAKKLQDAEALAEDLRMRLDAASEAKIQAEIQKEVDKGDLENRVQALRLELREGRLEDSVQHAEERGKIQETVREEVERLRQALEDERSRARQILDDGQLQLIQSRHQFQEEKGKAALEAKQELQELQSSRDSQLGEVQTELADVQRKAVLEEQEVKRLQSAGKELQQSLQAEQVSERQAREELHVVNDELQSVRADFEQQLSRLAAKPSGGSGSWPATPPDTRQGALEPGRLTQIQDRLIEEVQALRNANSFAANASANADLQEQNRALQARVALLEQQSPADRRVQAQRLAFLEKSVRDLEAERSALLVRATVAEEQLKQLQKHLKEITEDYQMQILSLKMKGMQQAQADTRCKDDFLVELSHMGGQLTCGCCAKEGSIIDDRQDSRAFFCRKPCGLDELETDFSCDPAGAFFEDTLTSASLSEMDRVSFRFAGSSNLAGLRWCFVYGASPKACDSNGTSLLHAAARAGSYQVVKDLVLRSTDVNAVDCAGWTPLHVASCMGRQDVSFYLLQAGAKSSKTSRGQTPEDLCSHPHTKEVVIGFEERRPKVVGLPTRSMPAFDTRGSGDEMGASLHFEPFFVPREPVLHEPRHREVSAHVDAPQATQIQHPAPAALRTVVLSTTLHLRTDPDGEEVCDLLKTMLAGLSFGKSKDREEKDDKDEKVKSKKDKKKEKRKEQKKEQKKRTRTGADKDEDAEDPEPKDAEQDRELAAAEVDFFGSMGKERLKEDKLKPDPEKAKVSEKEYNPFLRGEESNLPVPESASASSIPKHLCVGTPWAGKNDWRKRMQNRKDPNNDRDQGGEAPDRREKEDKARTGVTGGRASNVPGGPSGGGWRAKKAAVVRRSRSRSQSRRRSRSRSSGRRNSRRQRHRSRSRSSGSSSSAKEAERRKEQVAKAVLSRVKAAEAQVEAEGDGDADEVIRKLQSKYSKAAGKQEGVGLAASAEDVEDDIDPNKLGALAMEAMLSGDMARYEELNRRLEKHQATAGEKPKAFTLPPPEPAENVKVLEQVDAAGRSKKLVESVQSASVHTKGRNKRGTANAVPGGKDKKGSQGYYEDDDVSLQELIRRERIEGVQDYDANLEKHILKRGDRFKMLEDDEDEAYALGWYENADKKMDSRKGAEKRLKQEKNDKNRIQVNLERCTLCMESKKFFRKNAVMSVSPHAYLCVEAEGRCIVPGQVLIVPQEHVMAMTDADEAAWADIRNYQKCLISFYESEQPPRAVLFVESSVHRVSRDKALLGAGPHASIVAYPIEMGLLVQARTYWKKALDEAESEFETTHKKVIETDSKGGVRSAVPKGFPYIHVDFSLGGGFAHVIDNVAEFPRDFAQDVIAGMCEMTILDRAYTCKEEYRDACRDIKERFAADFDWTKALQA
ncbi:CWF19-like protein 2 [Symbiodinium microadriaticum]|uniref:CWF19-like protein 2 n=1 Tax=Symbiodinium microadriaticum TaxID=2951 RepID=A0A1Q9D257_SYMMI|nr:CWF19-like protein 2 [Symbiodinium microadriaticum]